MGENKGNIFGIDAPPDFAWLGPFKAQKDLTFVNDTGAVTLFTITGDVIIKIIPIVTTDVVPNTTANIKMGIVGSINAINVDTISTLLDARKIWVNQDIDSEIEIFDSIKSYIITDGNDIVLTLSAQVNSGAITFHCFWQPLNSTGNVVAA